MSTGIQSEMDKSSHKVIEKRRRDRINNCLIELSQSVPSAFAKQTSGKLEKAEILEMTVQYLRTIQATDIRFDSGEWLSGDIWLDFIQHYQLGYNECMREVVRFMTDVEGLGLNDTRCVRILSYLQNRFRTDSSINRNGHNLRKTLHPVLPAAKSNSCSEKVQSSLSTPRSFRWFSPYSINYSSHLSRLNSSLTTDAKPNSVIPSNIYPTASVLSPIRPLPKTSSIPLDLLSFQYNANRHTV